MSNCEDVRLFCNGYYPEIIVMDPFSLEILFMLSSKQNPDWISALHVSMSLLILLLFMNIIFLGAASLES